MTNSLPIRSSLLLILLVCGAYSGLAQEASMPDQTPEFSNQRDILYYVQRLFPKLQFKNQDSVAMPVGKVFAWILPSIGYEPQTRLAAYLGGNLAYRATDANVSSIYPILAYTQNKQLIFHTASNLWFPRNRLNLTGDLRVMHYPQLTYGLGGFTNLQNSRLIDYNYVRFYQTVSRLVAPNLYVGGGYSLDYHWAIRPGEATGDPVPIGEYMLDGTTKTVSSGLTINLLYDSRTNMLNPKAGFFANVQLRTNFQLLGSDTNYQSLLVDVRKYINWPVTTPNILAFWSYTNLTLQGTPPYLDLPSTGWDANSNVARGYIQGRFRGKNLLYGEVEYRFRLMRNGVLGGVAFANAQMISEPITEQFAKLLPAAGAGLRVKLNKLSGVNFAVDYGIGADGSRSLYFNIGELF
ncbi:BamA/TamA family outer membrane protein [Spirosoma gilvum]